MTVSCIVRTAVDTIAKWEKISHAVRGNLEKEVKKAVDTIKWDLKKEKTQLEKPIQAVVTAEYPKYQNCFAKGIKKFIKAINPSNWKWSVIGKIFGKFGIVIGSFIVVGLFVLLLYFGFSFFNGTSSWKLGIGKK